MNIRETSTPETFSNRSNTAGKLPPLFLDITAEDLLESVLKHSELIVWVIDKKGKIVFSRGAGLHALDLTDYQVVDQNVFDLYRDFPDSLHSINRALAGEEHHDFAEVNGASFHSWYCPIRDDTGQVVGMVGITTVITELAVTRRALSDATLQFHLAFQQSPVVMAVLKLPQGEIVDANHEFERVTGYTRAEVRGRTARELTLWRCPFERRDPNFDPLSLISFHDEEILATTKSGKEIVLVASGARLQFQSDDCILLFAHNETEETNTRKALKQSEQRFATLARQAQVGIFQCNAKGDILDANEFFRACFDGNVSQTGTTWFSLFGTDAADLKREWRQAIAEKLPFQKELPIRDGRPDVEWGLLKLDRFSDEEEIFIGSLVDATSKKREETSSMLQRRELEKAVRSRTLELEQLNIKLRDEVERRKQIAQELLISQERMQAVVKNAVDYIMHINLAGRIEFINRVAPGLTPAQVVDSHFSVWLGDKDRARGQEYIRQILEEQKDVAFEIPVHFPTGEVLLFAMRGAPIIVEGKIIGASIVARDITRERQLENEARQRSEELSHLSRLSIIGEMSANMSHELKQPLLAIGNYSNGCLQRIQEGTLSQEGLVDYLWKITRLSEKACQILRRTREFVAHRPHSPEPATIQELILDALQFVQTELDEHQIRIEHHYAQDLPQCRLDLVQIQQVIVNLLLNALEAIKISKKNTPHTISFHASRSSRGGLILKIRDTADGIEPGMQGKLFNAFQTSKPKGLGMGLAISRSIIENHGGSLKIEQSGPDGTTFVLTLPNG